MRVQVLYFAAVRELMGRDEEWIDLPDEVRSVGEFSRWIERHCAPLTARMRSVRIARNEVFARDEEGIAEGDVLALIPPVAGG